MHRRRVPLPGGVLAELCFTTRAEGDLSIHAPRHDLASRRAAVAPGAWTWLRQVHGDGVVVADSPGAAAGLDADAAVTALPGAVVSVATADCVPIALVGDPASVGAVHAGWRGLLAGVVPAAVDALRDLGARRIDAVIGPCIHAECYEFGATDLAAVVARVGADAGGRTTAGAAALDLVAAARAELRVAGVQSIDVIDECTACRGDRYFSHRARGDAGRQVLAARLVAPGADRAELVR